MFLFFFAPLQANYKVLYYFMLTMASMQKGAILAENLTLPRDDNQDVGRQTGGWVGQNRASAPAPQPVL